MKTQNGFIDPVIVVSVIGTVALLGIIFIGGPQYNVWQQSLAGKAELQKAEYTRQVAVLEAQAKKDSAQQLAEAEIIRAGGIAFFIGNPFSCIFHSNYNSITKKISELNYTTRWFVPSFELFEKAFTTIPKCFSSGQYWCSGKRLELFTADVANIEIKSEDGITSYHIGKGHSTVNTMKRVYLFTSVLFDI